MKNKSTFLIAFCTIFFLSLHAQEQTIVGIWPPGPGNLLVNLTNVNGTLFFSGDNGESSSRELWKSDGTEAGTVVVKDIRPGSDGSYPGKLTAVNGMLFFAANDGIHGEELWMSDGTEAGTVLVKDIYPGSESAWLWGLTDVNGLLYFSARDSLNGSELWKSDGTEAGTVMVKDISPGDDGTSIDQLTNVNGTLFFSVDDYDLWKSDGTTDGTELVATISFDSWLTDFTEVNGQLFFSTNGGTNGGGLWKSDGTAGGTELLKDFVFGGGGDDLIGLTDVNGTLFFSANDGISGTELWKSDGTAAGTVLVKDIRPGSQGSVVDHLAEFNGQIAFKAYTDATGNELWISDGTEAGTVLVKDIRPGSTSSEPGSLISVGETLYFKANDGIHGGEVWQSDGTEAGTVLVKDLLPGSGGTSTAEFTDVNGTLFFRTFIGSKRLWRTIAPGPACNIAYDINHLLGLFGETKTSNLYDNTGYTSAGDPDLDITACFADSDSLQNTAWFTFSGNGATYRIRSVTCSATSYNDNTQVAVFSGDCTDPVFVSCHEDEDTTGGLFNFQVDVPTEIGEGYYLLIDGYNGQQGEFCLEMTNIFDPPPTFPAQGDVCSNVVYNGLGNATPAGGIYSGPGVTDDGNGETFSFDPAAAGGAGTYSITYTGANGQTDSSDIVVTAIAGGTLSVAGGGTMATFCPGDGVADELTFASMGNEGTGFTLLITDENNFILDVFSSNSIDFENAFEGVYRIWGLSFTGNLLASIGDNAANDPLANECFALSDNFVTVSGNLPDVSLMDQGPFDSDAGIQSLSGGMPVGGTYSGPGVTDDGNGMTYTFDPEATGGGTHIIYYNYTDANGCSGLDSATIVVHADLPGNVCTTSNDINALFGQPAGEPQVSQLWDNTSYTSNGDPTVGFECFGEPDGSGSSPSLDRTIWYSFIGDGNTYRIRSVECNATNYIDFGDTQAAVFSGDCGNLTPVVCNDDENFFSQLYNFSLEITTQPGVTFYLLVDGFGPDFPSDGEFCLEVTNLTIPPLDGEFCTNANDINDLFGQPLNEPQTSDIWDNTGYNAIGDPTFGHECFEDGTVGPELNWTIWYTFKGDGNIYRIETNECSGVTNYLTNGDTQIAIYKGECSDLVPVACNEDTFSSPIFEAIISQLETEAGTDYYMLIDGGDWTNYQAIGEFCFEVTNLTANAITDIQKTDIEIFPNPTTGKIQLTNVNADQVDVFDNMGRLVFTKSSPGDSVDLSPLPPGVYFLKIKAREKVHSAKVVKE